MTKTWIKESLIIAFLLITGALFVAGLDSALVPLLISTFLAYASLPLVRFLESKGFSRYGSTALVLFTVVFTILLALILGLPPLFQDLREAIVNLPDHLSSALEKINNFLSEYGIQVPYNKDSLINFTNSYFNKISTEVFQTTGNFIKTSLISATSVVVIVLNVFLVPIFFIYVLNDCEIMLAHIKGLVPIAWQPSFKAFLAECDQILSGFIRGQLLVCAILAAVYSIGLLIVGLKFGLLIGCLTGLFTFIPYVGFGFGLTAAVVTALAQLSDGPGALIGVAIVYSIGQVLETYVVTPRIVGNKVGLSAFEAILALIVFGNLLGFVGLFLAIPVGAIVKVLLRNLLRHYKRTHFYKDL
jgi:predicted PurR-regulated permease PerM